MNGVFGTLDFLVFYVSWEVLLVPMLALIGVWGGEQRRYAALKFFVYTLAGSVLMLALLLALYNATPKGTDHTFDLRTLAQMWPVWRDSTLFGWPLARFGFFAVLIACLVKVPAVPVHLVAARARAGADRGLRAARRRAAQTRCLWSLSHCVAAVPRRSDCVWANDRRDWRDRHSVGGMGGSWPT